MDALAVNHLRNRLQAAERELERCAASAQHSAATQRWTDLAIQATRAAYAAGQVEALKAALDAASSA